MSRRTPEADRLTWVILLCLLPLAAQCLLVYPHPALLNTSLGVRYLTHTSGPQPGANRSHHGVSPAHSAGPTAALCSAAIADAPRAAGSVTGCLLPASARAYVGNPTNRAPPLLTL